MWRAKLYAAAIKAGQWRLNGETLKFNNKGQLEDGQHRCMAVIIANTAIVTYVVSGLEPGCFESIDRGMARSNSDMLHRAGEEYCCLLSAALAWLWRWENGFLNLRKTCPTWDECKAVLAGHPGIRNSLTLVNKDRDSRVLPPSISVCLHYLFSKVSRADADFFFKRLFDGENLSKNSGRTSAIYMLRRRLQADLVAVARLPQSEIVRLVVKAWSLMRANKAVRSLRVVENEALPEIK